MVRLWASAVVRCCSRSAVSMLILRSFSASRHCTSLREPCTATNCELRLALASWRQPIWQACPRRTSSRRLAWAWGSRGFSRACAQESGCCRERRSRSLIFLCRAYSFWPRSWFSLCSSSFSLAACISFCSSRWICCSSITMRRQDYKRDVVVVRVVWSWLDLSGAICYSIDSMSSVKKIISSKAYHDPGFSSDPHSMQQLITAVNQLEINHQTFKIIRILIKYFRFPILILFAPLYRRIEIDKQKYLPQHLEDLQKVASYARAILRHRKLPSLDFYFRTGEGPPLERELYSETDHHFIAFVEQMDNEIFYSAQRPLDELMMLESVERKIKAKVNAIQFYIEAMCLEHYQKIARGRIDEIQGQLKKGPGPMAQAVRPVASTIRIETVQGAIKQINDPAASNEFLCCRSYFYDHQLIDEPETLVQEYKNYRYPFNAHLADILARTICGFLNGKGGIIYIGISEDNQTKKRMVVGEQYSQSVKEKLHQYFRVLCQRIRPQIVNCQFYRVEFVPIKDGVSRHWVPGRFLLRVKVQKGLQEELYSFHNDKKDDVFAFRTQNEVLQKSIGQQILDIYRNRISQPVDGGQAYLHHPGPCKPVELGRQDFSYDHPSKAVSLPWDSKEDRNGRDSRNARDYGSSSKIVYIEKKQVYPAKKEAHKMQASRKPFLLWQHCQELVELERHSQRVGKNWFCFRLESKKHMEELMLFLKEKNGLQKSRLASQLIRVSKKQATVVERELDGQKVLNSRVSEDTFNLASPEEALKAMTLLQKMGVVFNFEISEYGTP